MFENVLTRKERLYSTNKQKELVGLTEEAITKDIEYLIMMGHISRTPNCQCLIIVAETKN